MPWHVDPGRMLGDSWTCQQNTWDPERASCDVREIMCHELYVQCVERGRLIRSIIYSKRLLVVIETPCSG